MLLVPTVWNIPGLEMIIPMTLHVINLSAHNAMGSTQNFNLTAGSLIEAPASAINPNIGGISVDQGRAILDYLKPTFNPLISVSLTRRTMLTSCGREVRLSNSKFVVAVPTGDLAFTPTEDLLIIYGASVCVFSRSCFHL